jgi:hypothetical protein
MADPTGWLGSILPKRVDTSTEPREPPVFSLAQPLGAEFGLILEIFAGSSKNLGSLVVDAMIPVGIGEQMRANKSLNYGKGPRHDVEWGGVSVV